MISFFRRAQVLYSTSNMITTVFWERNTETRYYMARLNSVRCHFLTAHNIRKVQLCPNNPHHHHLHLKWSLGWLSQSYVKSGMIKAMTVYRLSELDFSKRAFKRPSPLLAFSCSSKNADKIKCVDLCLYHHKMGLFPLFMCVGICIVHQRQN